MKLVIGLGNPEKKYERTLHNLGFMAVDELARILNVEFSRKAQLKGYIAQARVDGERVVLVKPTTYMNLSGECVVATMNFFKATDEDTLIVYDDLDLKTGTIRYRKSGSPGTHNGMRNISALTGSGLFPRVRIGSMPDDKRIPIIDYVLSEIPEAKKDDYDSAVKKAAACALDFLKGETPDRLSLKYNSSK